MKLCKINGELKLGSNEKGETFIWWDAGKKWLSMKEFQNCEIEYGTKLILQVATEKVKKNALSDFPDLSITPFNSYHNYSLSPTTLKLEDMGLIEYEQQSEPTTTPPLPPNPHSIGDIFTGIAASTALLMSVIQQVRQKKKEAESSVCCNNNKMEISQFNAKLQKLETEIKTKAESDNKGMIAEILETRKEIKDIKEEFEDSQENLKKLIEIIQTNNKNK
jgi:hypothetical protein